MKSDKIKTKKELLKELRSLQRQVAKLEKSLAHHKEVEAALRQAEEKYRNIFQNATEGIFQTNPEGRFLSANPSLAHIHGYDSPEDLMNSISDMTSQLYVNPEDRLQLVRLLNKYGSVQNFEVPMYRKDKSIHWISINIKAVKDSNGKVQHYEGTMQDITMRKLAEKALAESEERYRIAIEHSNDGVAILEGHIHQYVNKRFLEMFEYDRPEDVIGKSILATVHPDDREMVKNINRKRQKGEPTPSRYEFKGITKRGNIIYIEVSAATITYRDKKLYLIYLRDITERKIAENALRTERNRFQNLLENAPFGIAMVQQNGSFTYINPKFIEIFGYTLDDIPDGKTWFEKAYPDEGYRNRVIATWIEDVKNTKPGEKIPRVFEAICKDKTKKIINFIPVRLLTGEYLISCEDITERIKAHETLIKSHKELESLNRAKTKAVHHISHELKTPLAVIQGVMRILKRKLQHTTMITELEGIINIMEQNLERLSRISYETDEIFRTSQELESLVILDELDRIWQRMKTLSEIPPEIISHWNALKEWLGQYLSGTAQTIRSIDLYPFIQTALEKIKSQVTHRNIEFHLEGQNDLFIFIDPLVLGKITEGLIKNAIENTPDGSSISIKVEQKGDRVLLDITDCGIGITEENQQYIFDGLFHTRETDLYSSKKPYDFGAGGKGLDLMRIKLYGKEFGFTISLKSTRCKYIPTDKDMCPGNIAQCPHCTTQEDCKTSGGTQVIISFPIKAPTDSRVIGGKSVSELILPQNSGHHDF